jgi:endonuclease YncB( thermonuclease family)
MHPSHSRPAGLLLGLAVLGAALLQQPAAAQVEPAAPSAEVPAASGVAEPTGDLPTVEVTQHPEHTVPEGDAPPPPQPVTIKGRDGSVTALRTPPPPAHYSPSLPPVTRISGAARVTDVVSLSVLGRAVHLFGVRAPQASDRCPSRDSTAPRLCSEAGRGALMARLAANADIVCRVPPGQRAPVPAAVCHDAGGADLGGMLVAEGFALADPTQSYDYFSAEAAARQLRRGLWQFR